MSCDDRRLSLALRTYGELSSEEIADLEAHLVSCEACRAFARELESGLGRLAAVAAARAAEDLPDGWRPEVASAATRRGPRWVAAAASLAAGMLIGFALGGGQNPAENGTGTSNPTVSTQPAEAGFGRSTPPPLATTGGELGRLAFYLRR